MYRNQDKSMCIGKNDGPMLCDAPQAMVLRDVMAEAVKIFREARARLGCVEVKLFGTGDEQGKCPTEATSVPLEGLAYQLRDLALELARAADSIDTRL